LSESSTKNKQAHERADQGAIDADQLQVFTDLLLDNLRQHFRTPAFDDVGGEKTDLVTVAGDRGPNRVPQTFVDRCAQVIIRGGDAGHVLEILGWVGDCSVFGSAYRMDQLAPWSLPD
jgi:hypothetical protein